MISDAGMPKLCRTPAKEVRHFREMPWETISVGLAVRRFTRQVENKVADLLAKWKTLFSTWRVNLRTGTWVFGLG